MNNENDQSGTSVSPSDLGTGPAEEAEQMAKNAEKQIENDTWNAKVIQRQATVERVNAIMQTAEAELRKRDCPPPFRFGASVIEWHRRVTRQDGTKVDIYPTLSILCNESMQFEIGHGFLLSGVVLGNTASSGSFDLFVSCLLCTEPVHDDSKWIVSLGDSINHIYAKYTEYKKADR